MSMSHTCSTRISRACAPFLSQELGHKAEPLLPLRQGLGRSHGGTPRAALTWLHSLHTMRQPGSQSLKVRENCSFPEETL